MNALMKLTLTAAFTLCTASAALAQQSDHGAHQHASAQAEQSAAGSGSKGGGVMGQLVDGEIKKVNKEAEKITIRHGELKDLGMPAMTMVFRVKDPSMLEQVKMGDKVKFVAGRVSGQPTVMQMEVTQ